MNASNDSPPKRPLQARIAIAIAALAIGLVTVACEQGGEGDRCNPDLSHDECNQELSCQQPLNCPENYCCPTNGSSTDPFCQPGCNGGLAAICAADPDASACQDAGTPGDGSADAPDGATSAAGDAATDG